MILVDTHVHIHSCFSIGQFLDAAAANFAEAARRAGCTKGFTCVLCLTDSAQGDIFNTLSRQSPGTSEGSAGGWMFRPCPDGIVLRAESRSGQSLWIAAGRQIVSRDCLEVLALCTTKAFTDRTLALDALVEEVLAAGALAVVPWGAGKWLGRRGRILVDLISKGPRPGFFLGDNSGRPDFLAARSHFDLAAAKGINVLPGTDPLPFASEAGRAGRNGIMLDGELDASRPADDLKARLTAAAGKFTAYGEREGLLRFVRNQVAMQWVKRFNGRPSADTPAPKPGDGRV